MSRHRSTEPPAVQEWAAVYCRQSDPNKKAEDGMDHTLSLQVQREEAERSAGRHGFGSSNIDYYSEQITSELFEDRPELSRLVANAGKYKFIFVYKYNRLVRDPNQQVLFIQMMREKGVRVISATEAEPPPNPLGDLIHYIYGTFSKLEKQNIIDNTMRTKRRLLEEGKLLGSGKCLYGYRYTEQRTREIVEDQAEVVRRIFGWVCDGWSLRQIAAQLNLECVPGPLTTWKVNTLSILIRDPSYYGAPFLANKRKQTDRRSSTGSGRKLDRRNDPADFKPVGGPTPPIVSREVWDKAQIHLSDRKKRPRSSLTLFLRGHIFCARCGATMTASRERSGALYYRCNRSAHDKENKCGTGTFRVTEIEEVVWNKVLTARTTPAYLKERVAAALKTHERPDHEAQMKLRQDRLKKLQKKLDSLIDKFAGIEDRIIAQSVERNIKAVREEIEREQEIMAELERSLETVRQKAAILREVEARLLSEDGIKKDASVEEKVKVLDALAIRVQCSRNKDGGAVIDTLLFGHALAKPPGTLILVHGFDKEGKGRGVLTRTPDSPSVRRKFSR